MRACPESMTRRTPSMVSDVSATLVLTTTLRLSRITRHGGVLVGGRQFAVERQCEPPTQTRVITDFAQGPG